MRRILTLLCLLLAAACSMPAAALSMDVSGNTAGSPVVVTCDGEAFIIFQENGGTPVFAQGTTVRYVPQTTGTLSIVASAGNESATGSVTISSSGSGGGSSGDGDDDDDDTYQSVTLTAGNFSLTSANSGTTYTVNRRTALGALDASGAAYAIDDTWYDQYGTLYVTAVNGRTNDGARGWMFQVNGVSPSVGANVKGVQDGDRVVFYWSESMSSTPETSEEVIRLQVVYGSSSDENDETSTTNDENTFGQANEPEIPVGLPAGTTISIVGGKTRIAVDLSADHDGEQVIVRGDRIIIYRPGMSMTVMTEDITERDGIASGFIRSVEVDLDPAGGEIPGVGPVRTTASLILAGMPADARLTVTYTDDLTPGERSALDLAAREEKMGIEAFAYAADIETNGFEAEEIQGATIRLYVSPEWVNAHGGATAIRIADITADGTVTILQTSLVGVDDDGDLIFEADSPDGLSRFALVALGEGGTVATTTTAGMTTAPASAPETTPPAQAPIGEATVIAAALIGAGAHLIRRQEG
ncbi:DUF4430 domain-containing protein [Methanofollis fontis]|uniref:Transcobalamin-like C-terminal domain-containing protein n=1 Tax=Methanofollis fontis TaxID=2052832 RepID=A0A483CUV4_9EURY|nr:DUF4430 domain-containing protein [Methanofollis fontis]TAJ45237.1 hypothetical protein CUJ86_00330 [Methanofollis fontis]